MGPPDELPAIVVADFLTALSRDPVPQLDPALFGFPEAALRDHYDSMWTDDYPGHLVRLTLATGGVVTSGVVTVRAETQYAFMLPAAYSPKSAIATPTTFRLRNFRW